MATTLSTPPATKAVLEALLREKKLQAETPPLRGEDRRWRRVATGQTDVDTLLGGGFPRGQVSEVHGPASSGRTGLLLVLLARTTRSGALAALVDPLDRFDPPSAGAAGVALARLLWLRGPRGEGEEPRPKTLAESTAAVATLVGSGLFEVVVFDLADVSERERRRLPATTWIRLQRTVEETETALVILADQHVSKSPGGVTLALTRTGLQWAAPPGPGRWLAGLGARVSVGQHAPRSTEIALAASMA
jgi:RecA/RadA recombinase